ncbi:hypothetical protein CBR_g623 [Chara braunii]|uniref:CCHC-type domain-containing protein n=1 Tax=Chara braunii TaxID=69332 RepID=A0A388KBQ0_CHABU|nr:hypothetical protein CBR_g623 [Chara braunii]|eukprot:GBG67488.1 hypothetical protein CBR_g623 [Chara braunii]
MNNNSNYGSNGNGNGNGNANYGNGGNGNNGGNGSGVTCYNCGKTGHMARDCWSRRNQQYSDPELEGMKAYYRDMLKQKRELVEQKRYVPAQVEIEPAPRGSPRTTSSNKAATTTPGRRTRFEPGESSAQSAKRSTHRTMKLDKGKSPVGTTLGDGPTADFPTSRPTPLAAAGSVDKKTPASCTRSGMLDFVFNIQRELTSKRADRIKDMCHKAGIRYITRDQVVEELVCAKTDLAYEGFYTAFLWEYLVALLGIRDVLRRQSGNREFRRVVDESAATTCILLTNQGQISWMEKIVKILPTGGRLPGFRDKGVYVIMSPWCKKMYIGGTTRSFATRWDEHCRCLVSKNLGRSPVLYKWMRKFRWSKHVLIPLMGVKVEDVGTTEARLIGGLVQHKLVRELLQSRVRIVYMRNRSVGELLHNHRAYAELREVTCRCEEFPSFPKEGGHVMCRISEIQAPNFVKNSRNVTYQEGNESVQEVRKFADSLDGLVRTPVDRNPGDTRIVCPVTYSHSMKMAFVSNSSYEVCSDNENQVLKNLKTEYNLRGLHLIARWVPSGKLGRLYTIPKDKDLQRCRPIAPSCVCPFVLADRRVARALHRLLVSLPLEHHFNLHSLAQLTRRVGDAVRTISSRGGCDSLLVRCYDAKEMFTHLPHAAVIDGVEWLLDHFEERGFGSVKVAIRGKLTTLSRTRKKDEGFVTVDFEHIREALQFQLGMSFARCQNRVIRQTSGIPMGRATSPALACITCAHAERSFLASLGKDRVLCQGIRVIDDITLLVGFSASVLESIVVAEGLVSAFVDSFTEGVVLARKDGGTNVWDFLGTEMSMTTKPIGFQIWPKTKNMASLQQGKRLHFQSMQDFQSCSSKHTKINMVGTSVKRQIMLASSCTAAVPAICYVLQETLLRGHPPEVFFRGLANVARLAQKPILMKLLAMIRLGWKEDLPLRSRHFG